MIQKTIVLSQVFKSTNIEDYQVDQPWIKRMRINDPIHREEYNAIKARLVSLNAKVFGLYKLYNKEICIKYNAIRYFYYVNSYYRDQEQDDDLKIEGTDQNIIYKEQIVENENSCYNTRYDGRILKKVITATSMHDLCLSVISFGYYTRKNVNKLVLHEVNQGI